MIDEATVEQWMRDANPIRDLDDVDADEFARFVAAAHTRRAAVMQAPTQHPTPASPVTSPPTRRRRAWAFAAGFVIVLLVVGVAAWLLPSDEAPVADEPAAPTTVTTPNVATTAADEPEATRPADPNAPVVADGWRQVATPSEQPGWRASAIEALPGGGYVAIGDRLDLSFVMWSPTGVEWFDGDPQRLVEGVEVLGWPTRSLAAVGEQVVVLDAKYQGEIWVDRIALWIGDPKRGIWEQLPLDTNGIEGRLVGTVQLASDNNNVLVTTYAATGDATDAQTGATTEVVAWVVDPAQRTSERASFSIPVTLLPGCQDRLCPDDLAMGQDRVDWVDGRWIMFSYEDVPDAQGVNVRNALWTSQDGLSWSQAAIPDGMAGAIVSVAAGPSGAAAANCVGGDPPEGLWYSSDGLDWGLVQEDPSNHPRVIASWGDRGFVVWDYDPTAVWLFAPDRSGIERMPSPVGNAWVAAASGDTLIAVSPASDALWLYQEPGNE